MLVWCSGMGIGAMGLGDARSFFLLLLLLPVLLGSYLRRIDLVVGLVG